MTARHTPRPLVITRPEPDNQLWAAQLQALGHRTLSLPLMEIAPSTHPEALAALTQALAHWPCYRALMFVSANAVRYFFQHPLVQAAGIAPEALALRCWSPGPGTSKALLAAGVAPELIDAPAADAAQFESETLWQQVAQQVQQGDRVLIVRGAEPGGGAQPAQGTGRAWLAQQLALHQAQAVFAPVYERCPPLATPAWLEQLQACLVQPALWLFSSSECVQNLRLLIRNTPWDPAQGGPWQTHLALATHPRIAQQARALNFAQVLESRPALSDLHRCIQSLP